MEDENRNIRMQSIVLTDSIDSGNSIVEPKTTTCSFICCSWASYNMTHEDYIIHQENDYTYCKGLIIYFFCCFR